MRFTATASRDVTVRAVVQLAGTPQTTVLNKTAALSATPQAFEFTATSTVDQRPRAGQLPVRRQRCGVHAVPGRHLAGRRCRATWWGTGLRLAGAGQPTRVPGQRSAAGDVRDGRRRAAGWRLLDATDRVVSSGFSTPYGLDAAAGTRVQLIDFGRYRGSGQGFRLAVGDQLSEPFDLGNGVYQPLRRDSLAYFYNNRSGIPIEAQYVGEAYARPAGHVGSRRIRATRRCLVCRGRATTASTYGVVGTTRAITASTW